MNIAILFLYRNILEFTLRRMKNQCQIIVWISAAILVWKITAIYLII